MKRKISLILILTMIIGVMGLFPVTGSAAESTVVEFGSPAICVDAGTKVSFENYKVEFTDGTAIEPSLITWYMGDSKITEFTPASAGLYPVSAVYGESSKNVYIVAKEKDEKEFVLYRNDFNSESDISDWTLESGSKASLYSVENGKLIINATGYEMVRAMLPEWLGEFGDYKVETSVMTSDWRDASRWNALMFRIQNNTYPYYQMCVRKNTSSSNGVEFSTRTPSNSWKVDSTGSYETNQVENTFYTYQLLIKNDIVLEMINNALCVYNTDAKTYKTGRIGIQSNFSKMHVDYISVSVMQEEPEKPKEATLTITSATVENIKNAFTNVAYIDAASDFSALSGAAASAVLRVSGKDIVAKDGSVLCKLSEAFDKIGSSVIPIFSVNERAEADAVISYLNNVVNFDAAIMSKTPAVVRYARTKAPKLRGIIDFSEQYTEKLTLDDISAIRLAVNGNLAKTALLDIACLTKSTVLELQSQLLTVWASDSSLSTSTEAISLITSGAHGVVSDSPETVKGAYSFFAANTLTRTPLIIGHRGNPTQAPENSNTGYLVAYQNGSDVVETDVYLTADGEIIVLHDGTLDRTTNGTGNVESMTLAQIKECFLWSDNDKYKGIYPDEKVPTLREMFEALKDTDVKIFIEIKSGKAEICKKIADLIKEYDYSSRISVISFNATQLTGIAKQLPEMSNGYLLSNLNSCTSPEAASSQLLKQLILIQPVNTTYNVHYANLSKAFIDACNDRGVTVWPWTYNTSHVTQFANAFMWGYNGLTTNDAQYSKNTVKLIDTDVTDISLDFTAGEKTASVSVFSKTYGRKVEDIISKAELIVLEGEELFDIENGNITAKAMGKASFLFKYETKLPNGSKYTLYTSPVTLDIHDTIKAEESSAEASAETSDTSSASSSEDSAAITPDKNNNTTLIILLTIVGIVIIVSIVFVVVKRKK